MDEALQHLERAHALLLDGWALTRADQAQNGPLRFALGRIYYALDGRYDALGCVREIRQLTASAGLALDAERTARLDRELADAERLLSQLGFRPERRDDGILVSQGEPRLWSIARRVITPAEPVASPPPAPPPAMPPRAGFHPDPLPALSPAEWRRQRGQELFSEIAALGMHRVPQLGEPWRGAAFQEQRLLRDLDALLGVDPDSLGELESWLSSHPAPEPGHLFALTLVGGCLAGRDGLGMAERFARVFEEEEGFFDAWVTALALVPHPSVAGLLRAGLEAPQPERRAAALAALARRGEATADELWRGCHDHDRVATAALVPYALEVDARTRELFDELHGRVASSTDAGLRDAYTTAAILAGVPYARSWVERGLGEGSLLAARLFGIDAGRRDAERLLEWTATEPTEPLIEALGWAGDPACLPLLLGLLGAGREELIFAAASALERITGAGLRETYLLDAEEVIEGRPRLVAERNFVASREPEPEGSPDRIELPSSDVEAWRAYCEAHRQQLVPGIRTRRGAPYTPYVGLYEFDRMDCTPAERRVQHWELTLRSGLAFPFDVDAFVPTQERRIAALAEPLRQRSASPGSWERPSLRTAWALR